MIRWEESEDLEGGDQVALVILEVVVVVVVAGTLVVVVVVVVPGTLVVVVEVVTLFLQQQLQILTMGPIPDMVMS
jgi:hypothetical protein